MERAWLTKDRTRKEVAEEFEVSYRQFNNHFLRGHVEEAVRAKLESTPRKDKVQAGSRILDEVGNLYERVTKALDRTDQLIGEQDGSDPGVLLAAIREQMSVIREATRLLELGGRVTGELDSKSISLYLQPQWLEFRDLFLNVLDAYPEARKAVFEAVNFKLAARAVGILPAPASDEEVIEAEVVG